MWMPPTRPTTPGQWKVIGCLVVPLLVAMAVGMIIYGKITGSDAFVHASASFLGMATVVGIIAYFINKYAE